MAELQFIFITLIFVITIIFIVSRILSKKNRQKKDLPPEEEFSGKFNNLDKIIDGVSKKEQKNETIESETEEKIEEKSNHKTDDKKNSSKEKYPTKSSHKIDLKSTIISNELINKHKPL